MLPCLPFRADDEADHPSVQGHEHGQCGPGQQSEPGAENEHAERKERDPRQQELPEHPRFLVPDLEDFKSFERTDRPRCVTHGSHYAPA